MAKPDGGVYVVGAGLAGLRCSRRLRELGVEATVLEAADGVGGRVRTDRLNGFLLDRGFQVLLTAYPEAQRALDCAARAGLLRGTPFMPSLRDAVLSVEDDEESKPHDFARDLHSLLSGRTRARWSGGSSGSAGRRASS
jgi:phytoene dehydrogenase-like protein